MREPSKLVGLTVEDAKAKLVNAGARYRFRMPGGLATSDIVTGRLNVWFDNKTRRVTKVTIE